MATALKMLFFRIFKNITLTTILFFISVSDRKGLSQLAWQREWKKYKEEEE
jgi:hypothetical protein